MMWPPLPSPCFGPFDSMAPGLSPSGNLSGLSSLSSSRANLLSVTQRAPNQNDVAGYTVGASLWLDPTGQMWQLNSVVNGKARWITVGTLGTNPGAIVSGAVFQGSTRRVMPGWAGNLFTVTRSTDLATATIATLPDGSPDISTLCAFLSSAGGIGYLTTLYDQSGQGNNATQPVLASAPHINTAMIVGNNVPIMFDSWQRAYYLAIGGVPPSGTWAVSWTSGTSVTFAVTSSSMLPGDIVTGTNIVSGAGTGTISGTTLTTTAITGTLAAGQVLQGFAAGTSIVSGSGSTWTITPSQTQATSTAFTASTVISAINQTTGVATLSVAPTGTPGALVLTAPFAWLDLPAAMTVPFQSWSVVYAAQQGPENQAQSRAFILGAHGGDAQNNLSNWATIWTPTSTSTGGFAVINGYSTGALNTNALPGMMGHQAPQVFGFSMGGTGGRNLTYQFEGVQGSVVSALPATPAVSLVGGAIGGHRQWFDPGVSASFYPDMYLYDILIYPSTLTAANFTNLTTSISQARGWRLQIVKPLVTDGSSTTFGTGADTVLSWPGYLAKMLGDVSPVLPYNLPTGGSVATSVSSFPNYAGLMPAAQRGLLVVHLGNGNELQTNAAARTVTVQSGNVLTLNGGTVNTAFQGIGALLQGNVNLPAGATVAAWTTNTITVDAAHAPTGAIGNVAVINSPASNAWANIRAYCTQAVASGYHNIVLITSAARNTFTAPQLAEFNTLKTFYREAWNTLPGVVAYIDLEDFPEFGSDGGTMVVTGISGSNVTVNALSGATFTGTQNSGSAYLTIQSAVSGSALAGMTVYNAGVAIGTMLANPGANGTGVVQLSQLAGSAISSGTSLTASYAGAGSRVRWSGMPYSVAGDTGGQTITAVSGNVLTISGATTGLSVGSIIQAVNPTPWAAYPSVWSPDGQHFQALGYQLQASVFAQALLSNGLLP